MPETEERRELIIPNIIAARYASYEMKLIWDEVNKIILERQLWIVVMKAQQELGLTDITDQVIADYEAVVDQVDLASIKEREKITRHDVKARIEEFNDLAGHEHAHKGMTSRDLTENIEQLQVRNSLVVVRNRIITALARLTELSLDHADLVMVGRSHNVAAQPTTLGKRFASAAEELLGAYHRIETYLSHYKLRGIKGPMGTQQDMLDLFEGDVAKVTQLEEKVAQYLNFQVMGIPLVLTSVGQVYPRSMDYDAVSALVYVAAGPSSLATTLRLMAGHELATEGFKPGQVGSSAMPHKMNMRSCERINGFADILPGYVAMLGAVSGKQWNEGDVSDSVVRRVALPDAFFTIDGLFETFLTVLDELGPYPAVIKRELNRYLPFLVTTKVLMAAVKHGIPREQAHEAIKKHAVAVALDMREKGFERNDLLERLQYDDLLGPIPIDELAEIFTDQSSLVGLANVQVQQMAATVQELTMQFPDAAAYRPGDIL